MIDLSILVKLIDWLNHSVSRDEIAFAQSVARACIFAMGSRS